MLLSNDFIKNKIFAGLEKKDGIIAFCYYTLLLLWFFIVLLFSESNPHLVIRLPTIIKADYTLFILLVEVPSLLILYFILKKRKQEIKSVGLRNEGLRSSLLVGFLTIVMLLVKKIDLIYMLYYYLAIGFYEEVVFRGFIWPRLVVLLGKYKGTILCGIMFGIIHTPVNIVIKGSDPFQAILNSLGFGIVGHLFFLFIYTRNNNILLPSFVHGFLNSLGYFS